MIRHSFYETLKVEKSIVLNPEYHLARIEKTLNHFKTSTILDGIPLKEWGLVQLTKTASKIEEGRLRIDFEFIGDQVKTSWQSSSIKKYATPQRLRVAMSEDRDQEWNFKLCKNILTNKLNDCDDTLFVNKQGNVIETTRANVFVEIKGELVTPPLSCGVLAGTTRARLLNQGKVTIDEVTYSTRESIMSIDQTRKARQILICNSLMGLLPAKIVPHQQCPPF